MTGLLLATLIGLLAIVAPCQPLLLNSLLCRDGIFLCRNYTWILRMLSAPIEFFLFLNMIIATTHYFIEIMLKGVAFLWIDCKAFVKRYDKKLARIGEYDNLRIFEKCLNNCTRSRLFLVCALGSPAMQIAICYVAIELFRSNDQFKASLFLWVYFMTLFFTMIMFSWAAQINTLSREWLYRCRWHVKNKWERKVHQALTSMRLEFGNNFVETLTPLVVQEFCVRQTVSGLHE